MYKNLDAECARKGITKLELAKKLNIAPSTLYGKLKNPEGFSIVEAFKIEEILNCKIPLRELFEFNDCDIKKQKTPILNS